MSNFIEALPTLDAYWRGIILFGRNSASYKFALAKTLFEVGGKGKSVLTLEELAVPFSRHVSEHLKVADRQGTSASSNFLQVCRNFNEGKLTQDTLIEQTARLGFVNVIDAFHVVNQGEIPVRFYEDERKERNSIQLTDDFFRLQESFQARNLVYEVEARWRLVETAWSINISPSLLEVRFDPGAAGLFVKDRESQRIDVTSSIDALNGYQKGKCFYCFAELAIEGSEDLRADIDHFFPIALTMSGKLPEKIYINGVWNLVISCRECNRGVSGKFSRVPEVRYLERLERRNNYLIESHHPLKETLRRQTGKTEKARADFLRWVDWFAIQNLIHRWRPVDEQQPAF